MKSEAEREDEGIFYTKCAELLGVPYLYKPFPFFKKTRWNNREAGNGRFEHYGLIRRFSKNTIHVSLHFPITINKWFSKEQDVYDFLKSLNPKSV